jgi:flavin reductase (DIM6/NTAB) family NADH-FMN oxidoreductase RutF
MISINPAEVSTAKFHSILLGSVGPRPIAFASTIDSNGRPNLSPFSFFNAFGANPPTLVFSPARRVRDNTTKHTLENVRNIPEVVINVVTYPMVYQASLASVEYPEGVSEFEKAGFTPLVSEMVSPFRVKESPVQYECKVKQIIETGDQGGAGNLVICEVVLVHINEAVMDASQNIDQQKIDLVARMGGNWYCRAHGAALFEVEKPVSTVGIGIDNIPEAIRFSPVLTGNNLGQLGNVEKLPDEDELKQFKESGALELLLEATPYADFANHRLAQQLLSDGKVTLAWKVLLSSL